MSFCFRLDPPTESEKGDFGRLLATKDGILGRNLEKAGGGGTLLDNLDKRPEIESARSEDSGSHSLQIISFSYKYSISQPVRILVSAVSNSVRHSVNAIDGQSVSQSFSPSVGEIGTYPDNEIRFVGRRQERGRRSEIEERKADEHRNPEVRSKD